MRLIETSKINKGFRSPVFKNTPSKIDFSNFDEGGYYEIPYCVEDEGLVGRKFVLFEVNLDIKNGNSYISKPMVAEFKRVKTSVREVILLKPPSEDFIIFGGSCWSNTKNYTIYSYENLSLALVTYNNMLKEATSARVAYLQSVVSREEKGLLKGIVKEAKK